MEENALREQLKEEKRISLELQKEQLFKRNAITVKLVNFLRVSTPLLFAFSSYIAVHNPRDKFPEFLAILFLLMTGYAFFQNPKEYEGSLQRVQNELDLLNVGDTNIEVRAETLFKSHQLELKRYYDQTLKHSSWIFLTGLLCIICGFVFIGITFYVIRNSQTIEFNEKILLGAIGTASTLLANFIGAIYMKMYSETVKSLTEFHNRLVNTHHLHFGNFLLSKISNQELREKMTGEVVMKIAENKTL